MQAPGEGGGLQASREAFGGVGAVAIQLATARGATVIGTASEHNHDFLRSLGAHIDRVDG